MNPSPIRSIHLSLKSASNSSHPPGAFHFSVTELNLSHNYLRSLSVDLVGGLDNLATLDLDDNDISSVDQLAVQQLQHLTHFSLAGASFFLL